MTPLLAKVKPKCDRADECESGPGCTASSIAKCPYGYGDAGVAHLLGPGEDGEPDDSMEE